ncbi:hypothetical protein HDU98_000083 [Podochytrium sp. JEL0797]|nr:hypothetical protein HDU98_000083 [Podochytrium sp. JEL0797]
MLYSRVSATAPPAGSTRSSAQLFINGDKIGQVDAISHSDGEVHLQLGGRWFTFASNVMCEVSSSSEAVFVATVDGSLVRATLTHVGVSEAAFIRAALSTCREASSQPDQPWNQSAANSNLIASLLAKEKTQRNHSTITLNNDSLPCLKVLPPWPLRPVANPHENLLSRRPSVLHLLQAKKLHQNQMLQQQSLDPQLSSNSLTLGRSPTPFALAHHTSTPAPSSALATTSIPIPSTPPTLDPSAPSLPPLESPALPLPLLDTSPSMVAFTMNTDPLSASTTISQHSFHVGKKRARSSSISRSCTPAPAHDTAAPVAGEDVSGKMTDSSNDGDHVSKRAKDSTDSEPSGGAAIEDVVATAVASVNAPPSVAPESAAVSIDKMDAVAVPESTTEAGQVEPPAPAVAPVSSTPTTEPADDSSMLKSGPTPMEDVVETTVVDATVATAGSAVADADVGFSVSESATSALIPVDTATPVVADSREEAKADTQPLIKDEAKVDVQPLREEAKVDTQPLIVEEVKVETQSLIDDEAAAKEEKVTLGDATEMEGVEPSAQSQIAPAYQSQIAAEANSAENADPAPSAPVIVASEPVPAPVPHQEDKPAPAVTEPSPSTTADPIIAAPVTNPEPSPAQPPPPAAEICTPEVVKARRPASPEKKATTATIPVVSPTKRTPTSLQPLASPTPAVDPASVPKPDNAQPMPSKSTPAAAVTTNDDDEAGNALETASLEEGEVLPSAPSTPLKPAAAKRERKERGGGSYSKSGSSSAATAQGVDVSDPEGWAAANQQREKKCVNCGTTNVEKGSVGTGDLVQCLWCQVEQE